VIGARSPPLPGTGTAALGTAALGSAVGIETALGTGRPCKASVKYEGGLMVALVPRVSPEVV